MEIVILVICLAALLWWGELALEWWFASRSGVDLADLPEASGGDATLSAVVPARDEAAGLEEALGSLLEALPGGGEVILVDDRSSDGTGAVAASMALRDARLKVIHLTEVPEGWLGKNHALQAGYEASAGKYLLFTDADVVFHPGCLSRAVAYCEEKGLDHLVATPQMVTEGIGEKIFVLFFSIALVARYRLWRASLPRSRFYAGIGAFNLLRRSAYEGAGTHRAIRAEVVDDLELGRLVKGAGGKQKVVSGEKCLRVRWNVGLGGLIRGLEKNAFAGFDYHPARTVTGSAALLVLTLVPFLAPLWYLGFGAGSVWALSAGAGAGVWVSFAALYRLASGQRGVRWVWFPTFPAAAFLLTWAVIRSMVLYYRRGGVSWRGTVYRRDEGGIGKEE